MIHIKETKIKRFVNHTLSGWLFLIVCLAVFSSPLACFLLCFYQRPRVVLISAAVHNPSSISGKKIDVARATTRLASDSRRRCQCQNRKPRGALTKGYSPLAYTMCHCFSPPSSSILQKLFELKYDEHVLNNEYYQQQQQSVCSSPSL